MELEELGGFMIFVSVLVAFCASDILVGWAWTLPAAGFGLGLLLVVADRLTRRKGE